MSVALLASDTYQIIVRYENGVLFVSWWVVFIVFASIIIAALKRR